MTNLDTDTSSLFSFLAKLQVTIGDQTAELKQANRLKRAAYLREYPRTIRLSGSVASPASGVAVIPLNQDGPDQGHFWYVRKLAIAGVTPTTVALGRLDVFVSPADMTQKTALADFSMADWQDQATAIPLIGLYGRGELPLQFGEKLWLVLSGATSGQQYVVNGIAEDYQESVITGGGLP